MSEQRLLALETCVAGIKKESKNTVERVVRLEVQMVNTNDLMTMINDNNESNHLELMTKLDKGDKRLTTHMAKEESTKSKITNWLIITLFGAVVVLAGVNYDTLRAEHDAAIKVQG